MKIFNKISKEDFIRDSSVLVIAIIVICFFAYYPQRHLIRYCRYTIATVREIDYRGEGDPSAVIFYTVNGTIYTGIISSNKGNGISYKTGDRVFIKFSPVVPDESSVIQVDVPDDLREVPANGWEAVPVPQDL